MVSYNQELKVLNDIGDAHLQLRSFGSGAPTEIGNDTVYPLMWVTPQTNPVSITTKALNSQYKIIFADLVTADKGNEAEVLSDMKQVALDVVAQLQLADYQDLFTVEPNGRLEPFTEEAPGAGTADKIAGWILDITLRVDFLSDRCAVPSTLDPSATPGCEDASILKVGGVVLTVVESGGTIYTTDIIELMTPAEVIADFTTAGYLPEITESISAYRQIVLTFEPSATSLIRIIDIEWTGYIKTINLTNCTAVYTLDGVVVTPQFNVTKGQKLKVTVTVTDTALAAKVNIYRGYHTTVAENITNYAMQGEGRYYFFIDNISSPNRLGRIDLSNSAITYYTLTAGITYKSIVYRNSNNSLYIFASTQWCRLQTATGAASITDVTTIASIGNQLWSCYNTGEDVFVIGGSRKFNPATGAFTLLTGVTTLSRLRYNHYINSYTSGEYTGGGIRARMIKTDGTVNGGSDINITAAFYASYDLYYNQRNGYYYLFLGNTNLCHIYEMRNHVWFLITSINLTSITGNTAYSTIGVDTTRNYIFSSVFGLGSGGGVNCTVYVISCNNPNSLVGTYTFATVSGETGAVYCTYNNYLDRYLIVPRSATCSRIKVFNPNTSTFDADISITPINTNLTVNNEERLFMPSEINYELS